MKLVNKEILRLIKKFNLTYEEALRIYKAFKKLP